MMDIVKRFIGYTAIDTTSDGNSKDCPSTPSQFELAHRLVAELKDVGVSDAMMAENGFVYGHLGSNQPGRLETVGFLAHLDTSDATSGKGIKARIIEEYDGKDIVLSADIVTAVADYPFLEKMKGKTLVVTDGTTLLGGDDKAGIAIIMEMLQRFSEDASLPHGPISVCFTPDEEIGVGITHIDKHLFGADFAYTLDGGAIDEIAYENFNAASAHVRFNGNSIHPGSAKGKMINALQLAMDFHAMLPVFDRPEFTEKREGFNHLLALDGTCQQAEASYIIRNHDADLLEKQKNDFIMAAQLLNKRYGHEVVSLTIADSYRNMKEGFVGKEHVIDDALSAFANLGMAVRPEPIRGGTDGSWLTVNGVPTPNLPTGGYNFHGNHELVVVEDMKRMADVLVELNAIISRKAAD